MQELNLEKLAEKLDRKKIEELAEIIDQLPTLNEILKVITQLKESGSLDVLIDLSYSAKLVRDMLTDDVIENIASYISSLLELFPVFSSKRDSIMQLMNNLDVLSDLIPKMKELKDSGALDAVFDATYFLKIMKDMLSDETIENLAALISSTLDLLPRGIDLINRFMNSTLYNIVNSLTSPEAQKMLANPPKVTLLGLISSFRDEDVQRGMGILITILKILGKNYKINLS